MMRSVLAFLGVICLLASVGFSMAAMRATFAVEEAKRNNLPHTATKLTEEVGLMFMLCIVLFVFGAFLLGVPR